MKFLKFDKINSTNDYLKEHINEFENYDIVSAKIQTLGRGRRGNTWLSSEGMAMFSFLLENKYNLNIKDYTKLPMIAGIAVLNTLKKISNENFTFKWTNDIYYKDKKIAGILVEKNNNKFIIGIGININNKIPKDIENIAISLGKNYNIDEIILTVVSEFSKYYEKFVQGEWNKILEEINFYNHLKNKNIRLKIGNNILSGKALNIAEDGRIEIFIDNDIKLFNAGEIQIEKGF